LVPVGPVPKVTVGNWYGSIFYMPDTFTVVQLTAASKHLKLSYYIIVVTVFSTCLRLLNAPLTTRYQQLFDCTKISSNYLVQVEQDNRSIRLELS